MPKLLPIIFAVMLLGSGCEPVDISTWGHVSKKDYLIEDAQCALVNGELRESDWHSLYLDTPIGSCLKVSLEDLRDDDDRLIWDYRVPPLFLSSTSTPNEIAATVKQLREMRKDKKRKANEQRKKAAEKMRLFKEKTDAVDNLLK